MNAVAVDHEVVVVGAGFSGIGMGVRLGEAGIDDYVVLEKGPDVGGTWRDNRYPGCACDVPANLYSFSFAPNPDWTRRYAGQPEIWEYLRRCADRFGVTPHVRTGVDVVGAEHDDARGVWRLRTGAGETITCRALVLGVGGLHEPAVPDIPGLSSFAGPCFHSSRWEPGCDLSGMRVAVIGTGASAIQIVPGIAERVQSLHLFQRTPPWVLPRGDRPIPDGERRLLERVPLVQWLRRGWLYWMLEARGFGFTSQPAMLRVAEKMAAGHIRRQIADPELRRAVTPDYRLGCKRILLSDDYYPALTRPNVELVTGGVREVRPHGIVGEDGVERAVDAIVLATGFDVTGSYAHLGLRGRGGVTLAEAWSGGAEAYLGMTVAGFPNCFLLTGPNTGLGHTSMVLMIEAQVGYVVQALRMLREGGARSLEVRPEAQTTFNRRLQSRLARAVWSSGCRSWYLDEHGVNRTLWPSSTLVYRLLTRRVRAADYVLEG